MIYEIDQSGRIEETNRDTIISIANKNFSKTVRIKSSTKRSVEYKYKKLEKPKMFAVYGFTAGVVMAIKESKLKNGSILIDIEYPSYEKIIGSILRKIFKDKFNFKWKNIGRSSPAHNSAYRVFKKRAKADFVVSQNELEYQMKKFRP